MSIQYFTGSATIQNLVLDVTCEVCNITAKYELSQLSVSHVSNDGKRGGVFFTLQCPFCLTWHTEVGLYKSVSDGKKG